MSETRKLNKMLDALRPAGSHLGASGWIYVPELAESIIRRCAEVAHQCQVEGCCSCENAGAAILREAGLKERD